MNQHRHGKPNKRPRSDFKNIVTLRGLSHQDRVDFAWNDMRRFFKVSLWDRYKHCKGCNKPFKSFEDATLDHIVPRSKGGRTRLSNLQLMHSRCNSRKTNKMPLKYSRRAFIPVGSNRGAVTKYMIKRGLASNATTNS